MGTWKEAARDSVAGTEPTSLSSSEREKFAGGLPVDDQQVTLPQ